MPGEGKRGLGQEKSLGIREVKGPGGHQSRPSLYSPASWDWGSRTPCSPHFYPLRVKLFIYPQGPVPPSSCPIVFSDLQGVDDQRPGVIGRPGVAAQVSRPS